jgi:Topoisomerase DNA binding C4 zinc finger
MPAPPCPDCGANTKLRSGRYGMFFGCTRYPDCKGLQAANRDGEPVGTPATVATRKLRAEVIQALKAGILDPVELPRRVSEMNAEDCEASLRRVFHDPEPVSLWQLLADEEWDELSKP